MQGVRKKHNICFPYIFPPQYFCVFIQSKMDHNFDECINVLQKKIMAIGSRVLWEFQLWQKFRWPHKTFHRNADWSSFKVTFHINFVCSIICILLDRAFLEKFLSLTCITYITYLDINFIWRQLRNKAKQLH